MIEDKRIRIKIKIKLLDYAGSEEDWLREVMVVTMARAGW